MRRMVAVIVGLACAVSQAGVVVTLDAVPTTPESKPRWRDVAGNTYSETFRQSFRYEDAVATVDYETIGSTFTARFVADGLKPCFAYQLKFQAGHDSPGMEQLGSMGRWWWEGGPLNVSDASYEANRDNPAISSFLVFDYAVSDEHGHIEKDIFIDSTYHVLWRYGVSGVPGVMLPGPNDGYLIETLVDPTVEPGGAYDLDYAPDTIFVFGEYEHTAGNVRPLPGELVMSEGAYELTFLVTEESFHSYDELGGFWQHALIGPPDQHIRFTIAPDLIPEPATLTLLAVALTAILARRPRPRR